MGLLINKTLWAHYFNWNCSTFTITNLAVLCGLTRLCRLLWVVNWRGFNCKLMSQEFLVIVVTSIPTNFKMLYPSNLSNHLLELTSYTVHFLWNLCHKALKLILYRERTKQLNLLICLKKALTCNIRLFQTTVLCFDIVKQNSSWVLLKPSYFDMYVITNTNWDVPVTRTPLS